MARAFIQLVSKGGALAGNRIEFKSVFIPRVGELIDAHEFMDASKGEVGYYIVESVVYRLTPKGFVPYITARQWLNGSRWELLKERGWLIPDRDMLLLYDQDDPAILEPVKPTRKKRK